MMLSGFPSDGVIAGLKGSSACWLKFVGKFLASTGSGTVRTEGKGLALGAVQTSCPSW